MKDRKLEEKQFHNQRELDRNRLNQEDFLRKYSNKKWYAIKRKSEKFWVNWLKENSQGKRALDYGCGLGGISLRMAQSGATVFSIDISEESVKTTKNLLAEAGKLDNSQFFVMDAEKMSFLDNMFDIIVCSGVLHHLDVEKAFPELARVLKSDGKILCYEALGYNPLINAYRKRTPHLRTEWEADHILTLSDVKNAKEYFNKIKLRYFHLFSICAVPFRKTVLFKPLLSLLEILDSLFLRLPYIQRLSWQIIFILSAPKEN